MHQGHYVFAQLMQHLPLTTFRRCVARYNGEYRIQQFSCLDQYLCLAFAQLTYRESLRDIEACLRAQAAKLYHLGFRSASARNTLANANEMRDWRIYADFAQHLIGIARRLYAERSAWRWTSTRPSMRSIRPPSICACRCFLGRRSDRPRPPSSFIHCLICAATSRRSSSSATAKCTTSIFSINSFLRPAHSMSWIAAIIDFERLGHLDDAGSFFVTRAKSNLKARRRYSHPVDRTTGLICDQTVCLTGFYSRQGFDRPLRRIKFNDPQTDKRLVFLTNNFALAALTIAKLYHCAGRWNCSSNGSSSTCGSKRSSAPARMPSNRKSGSPSRSTVYVLVAIVKKTTKFYRF